MSVTTTSITPEWGGDRMLNPALLSHRDLIVDNSASYMEPADAGTIPYVRFSKIVWKNFLQVSETEAGAETGIVLSRLTNSSFVRRQQGLLHSLHTPMQIYTMEGTQIGAPSDMLSDERLYALAQSHDAIDQYYTEIIRTLVEPSSFEEVVASLNYQGFGKCAKRLIYLQSSDDSEEGDEPLTLESAQGFVRLIRDFKDLGEPLLGLFSEGTLSVEWRIADDKHLLIEPLDSENASFALIGPSSKRGDRFRLNGRGKIADIINTLQKNGVAQWGKI